MSKEAMKLALEAAYLAGFNASGEGYNGEYPFGDHARNPEEDAAWIKDRDNALRETLAEQPAPMIRGDIRDGLVDDEPAQQEPVAWMRHDGTRCCPDEYRKDYPDYETRYPTPLYAHPAAQGSPVAWMVYAKDGLSVYVTDNPTGISEGQRALPLYTSPQPAQPSKPWVGLEPGEISKIATSDQLAWANLNTVENRQYFARAIEAKLKEKNT